jgi:hypothetical protein
MHRRISTPLLPLVLLFCSVSYLSAQTKLEATLRAKYDQKILMLRNFYNPLPAHNRVPSGIARNRQLS